MAVSPVLFDLLMAIIVVLSFINCFQRPDYNLPIFVAYMIVWNKQKVPSANSGRQDAILDLDSLQLVNRRYLGLPMARYLRPFDL